MAEFVQAVSEYAFLRYALLAGVLGSLACGIVGSYVTVRRISYIAGAISHCTLGGMGLALYLQRLHGLTWCHPLAGALVAALLAALIIGLVNLYAHEREDTVLGAVWAIGMAIGIFFISRTPGYNSDLMSYLFGNILMVAPADIWWILVLDGVVLTIVLLFYNQFLAVCFDEENATLRGVPTKFFYLLLLCLTALTVVILVQVVGIVMVIALLCLPAATMGLFARRLVWVIVGSIALCAAYTAGGLALSYAPDLPAGATIVILAGAGYLLCLPVAALLRRHRSKPA